MNYNLGNFGDQLSMDEVNGALGNAGADFQFQDQPTTASLPPPAWEQQQHEEQKKKGALGGALGLVGSLVGGVYGAALSAVGSMQGGNK